MFCSLSEDEHEDYETTLGRKSSFHAYDIGSQKGSLVHRENTEDETSSVYEDTDAIEDVEETIDEYEIGSKLGSLVLKNSEDETSSIYEDTDAIEDAEGIVDETDETEEQTEIYEDLHYNCTGDHNFFLIYLTDMNILYA